MWGQAQAQLQEAVKNPAHRPKKLPHRGELTADPTVGNNGCPKDRKSEEIKRHGVPNDPTVASYGKPKDRTSGLEGKVRKGEGDRAFVRPLFC